MAANWEPKQISGQRSTSDRPERDRKRGGVGKAALILFILALIMLAVGVIPRVKHNRAMASDARSMRTQPTPVNVLRPTQDPPPELLLPATTQAVEDSVVGARATGYVKKWYFDIGAHVHKGQVLAEIESPDTDAQLAQAQRDTARAYSAVRQARADVFNKLALVAQGNSNVKQAEASVQQTRALAASAEAKLTEAQQDVGIQRAALSQAQAQLNLASKTLERYKTLLQYGYVALQDVDQAQATYDTDAAAVRSAQASLEASLSEVRSNEATVLSYEKNVQAAAQTVAANRAAVTAAVANARESEAAVHENAFAAGSSAANTTRAYILKKFEQVTAPFDGVITARNIDVGALINAGSGSAPSTSSSPSASPTGSTLQASNGSTLTAAATVGSASSGSATPATAPGTGLFGLARIDTLILYVAVPEAYAGEVIIGLPATISFRELPRRKFHGTVIHRSGALDSSSRMLLTEVQIANKDGKLLPGMYAQVQFDLPRPAEAVRIPATAVVFDSLGSRVATVTPQNKLHFVTIGIARDLGNSVEANTGVSVNDTLVAIPSDDMYEGEPVKPVWPPPPGSPPHPVPAKTKA